KVVPPSTITLAIPASALADHFAERTLVHLPVELTAVLPNPSWKFWQSSHYTGSYPFSLELMPKKPLGYVLKEVAGTAVVDEKRTLVVKGRAVTIPGCGAPGCEKDHSVCVDVPEGAKPLEPIDFFDRSPRDSTGSGWTTAVVPSPTGICTLYKQRSPGLARE